MPRGIYPRKPKNENGSINVKSLIDRALVEEARCDERKAIIQDLAIKLARCNDAIIVLEGKVTL